MIEATQIERNYTKPNTKLINVMRALVLGFVLSVGMNIIFLLAGLVLSNFFGALDRIFLLNRTVLNFSTIGEKVTFGVIFFINFVIFIFLLIKRRFTAVGMVIGVVTFVFGLLTFLVLAAFSLGFFVFASFWTIALLIKFPAGFLAVLPIYILLFLGLCYAILFVFSFAAFLIVCVLRLFNLIPTDADVERLKNWFKKWAGIRVN